MRSFLLSVALAVLCALSSTSAIKVGETIPDDLFLDYGFPPTKVDLKERLANKKTIFIGLPGAFTPT